MFRKLFFLFVGLVLSSVAFAEHANWTAEVTSVISRDSGVVAVTLENP
ncbi:hypothetical protein [Teredinibacter sp. KSP-S5-2]|nr:hypothetical protein [Teredinibacter sp. KSP-S5-2]WNO10315.1 hypothetical protein P5V12_03925 [Teredinibacter sp. KSP-S5-2]